MHRRIAILTAVAVALGIAVVFVIAREPKQRAAPTAASTSDGGAAVRAPSGPQLPDDGVRLAGVVVDGAGVPVEGAEVRVEPESLADRSLGPTGAAGDTGAPRPGVARDAGVAGMAAPAPTGSDGRFAIGGLEPGRYRVRVAGSGLFAAELRMIAVPAEDIKIVVARQVSIEGSVTDAGNPIAGATVGVRGDAIGGTLEVKTDRGGRFSVPSLPEGRYQVFAWQGPLAARTVRVSRLGAGPFAPIALRLEAGTVVVGRVVDREEGIGLAAAIELRSASDDEAPRYVRSRDDGSFRIEGVPAGRWIADAFAPGYVSPGGVELEAGQGIFELALVRGATIEGRVLDADGNPVEGATVRALGTGPNASEHSAQVDRDRLRRFSGRTAAPPADPTSALASDPLFVPRGELGVLLGPIPPIPPPGAVGARPASIVDQRVVGGGLVGEPAPLPEDPMAASIWVTGRDGRYRIRGLPRGKHHVLAAAPGFADARSRQVSVAAGQVVRGVDIVLDAGTILVGKVSDPRGAPVVGARVTAKPEVGLPLEAFTDGDGMYRVGPVSGKVELVATAYGHTGARRTIAIEPAEGRRARQQREDLVLDTADAILAGALDDVTGAAVAGATLEIVGGSADGRTAVTSADGTFELTMLPKGRVRVRVTHPDYPAADLEAVASTTGERARLRLPLGGQVEGVLLDDATGDPIPGTTIDARGPAGATADATTDAKGLWRLGPLRPGTWRIEVKLPGYRPAYRELDVPVSRAPGTTSVRDIRIELARGALVGGTVRDRRGQRVMGARITVRRADGTGEPATTETDAQGEFRVHDAPTGTLVISAVLGDEAGSTSATVRGGDEVLGLSIEIR